MCRPIARNNPRTGERHGCHVLFRRPSAAWGSRVRGLSLQSTFLLAVFFCTLAGDGLAPAAPPTLLQCRHADLQRQARRSAVRRLAVGRCASIASSETVLGRMGVYARAPFGWLWRPYCEIFGGMVVPDGLRVPDDCGNGQDRDYAIEALGPTLPVALHRG